MKGPVLGKVARLAANLAAHPQFVVPYLKNYLHPQAPIELEIPWFSYTAIRFLDHALRPQMLVYEYGSGGSTLYFSKRCARVVSIEDNPEWYGRVTEILRDRHLTNVDLRHEKTDLNSVEAFCASGYPDALPNEKADVIVVDGSELDIQLRPICFAVAESRIKIGGMIIVDDSWRYTQLRKQNHAKKVQIFQSVGPARPGVTSTDIFFY